MRSRTRRRRRRNKRKRAESRSSRTRRSSRQLYRVIPYPDLYGLGKAVGRPRILPTPR